MKTESYFLKYIVLWIVTQRYYPLTLGFQDPKKHPQLRLRMIKNDPKANLPNNFKKKKSQGQQKCSKNFKIAQENEK